MTKWLKKLWFKLTYDEIAMKCRRPLGKSLFIFVLMSGICSAQTSILTYDVNGVTRLHARLNAPYVPSDPPPVYPPNPVYIGIPSPTFGIDETYRMYDISDPEDPNYCRNPDLTYYPSDSGGYYTGWVDMYAPGATNTNNPYGTEAKPRTTIPVGLPPGSVIEVHGTVNWSGPSGEVKIDGVGTKEMPIFIRGIDDPRTERAAKIGHYGNAQYIIVEGLSFLSISTLSRDSAAEIFTNSYICVRDCNMYLGGTSAIVSAGDNPINNIVYYNNLIHEKGDWDSDVDQDKGGLFIQDRASYIWALDNTIWHVAGTAIGIGPSNNATADTDNERVPHHIYVGGNHAYETQQSPFGTKKSRDVVFSQNVAHDIRGRGTGSPGAGILFQYGQKRLWILFNYVYDNKLGIYTGDGYGTGYEDVYIIGNVFNNLYQADGILHSGSGMELNGVPDVNVCMNTIYNANWGIRNFYGKTTAGIYNNIISDVNYVVDFKSSMLSSYAVSHFDYNIMNNPVSYLWDTTYANLAAFQAGPTDEGNNCLEADPLFINTDANNFDMQEGTPVKGMSLSSEIQEISEKFYNLYGITNLSYYMNQLFLEGKQNAPKTN